MRFRQRLGNAGSDQGDGVRLDGPVAEKLQIEALTLFAVFAASPGRTSNKRT